MEIDLPECIWYSELNKIDISSVLIRVLKIKINENQ